MSANTQEYAPLEVRAGRPNFFIPGVDLVIYTQGKPCLLVPVEQPDAVQPPCHRLDPNGAQRLMDDLWAAGVRPTEGSGSAGALAATQKHLEDMRTLVFRTHPKSALSISD